MRFDKRITAIRTDIASDYFKGLIKRKKFVQGKKHTVISVYSPLYSLKNSKLRECRTIHSAEINEIFFRTLDEFDCSRNDLSILR